MDNIPVKQNFRMPAEWEPHESTWLTWPQTPEYWPDINAIESTYISMIRTLIAGENVDLLINDQLKALEILQKLKKENIPENKIRHHIIATKDIWIRDYGPSFLVKKNHKQLAACCWKFNTWGEKYNMPNEPKVARKIQETLGLHSFTPKIVMEGGAIEINDMGTCLTTASCLLNPNRNPGKTKKEVESSLKDFLGVKQIIWCEGALEGDDTDGHIDNLARFVNTNTILCAYEDDKNDSNYENLKHNYEILKHAKDQKGNSFNLVKVPMPGLVKENERRLPASYINFYISNAAVLLPTFNNSNDDIATKIIKHYFPQRNVVPIPSSEIMIGNGGPHCATQQQPMI